MRIFRAAIVVVVGMFFALPSAHAASSPYSPYAAATPVENQSAAVRVRAFADDLAAVFVKVSGRPGVAQSPALAAVLARADQLVLEYRYRRTDTGTRTGLELWARFDAQRVNAALAAAGAPIWGENRPRVVAWVLAPDGVIASDLSNPVARAMRATAEKRGLPLVLPLFDLTDQQRVSEFDIRSFFLPAIETASQRYRAQALLIGTIRKTAAGVTSQWRLALGENGTPFAVPAPTPASAAAAAVARTATSLAQRFARLPGQEEQSTLGLTVTGVNTLKGEATVRRAIAGVRGVKDLRLTQIEAGRLHFVVSYAGSAADFAHLLALSGVLAQSAAPIVPVPSSSAFVSRVLRTELEFRYTP